MLPRYLILVFAHAFRLSLVRTDVLLAVMAAAAPVAFSLLGRPMPESISLTISILVGAFVVAVALLRLISAPFFVWRDDQKKIEDLAKLANSPDRRELEVIAEERARRRFAAADEVTRIRTVLIDKKTTKEQKKQAFRGAQYHSYMFWDDEQFVNAWEEFYEACNGVYKEWIKWEATSAKYPQGFFLEHNLERAIGTLNQKANDLRGRILPRD